MPMRWILSWRHKKRHSSITSHDCREFCDFIGHFLFLWRHDKIPPSNLGGNLESWDSIVLLIIFVINFLFQIGRHLRNFKFFVHILLFPVGCKSLHLTRSLLACSKEWTFCNVGILLSTLMFCLCCDKIMSDLGEKSKILHFVLFSRPSLPMSHWSTNLSAANKELVTK